MKKIWAGLSIIAGVVILIWWFPNLGIGLVTDCWIGGYCFALMIPAIVGVILIVVGLIYMYKGGKDEENH